MRSQGSRPVDAVQSCLVTLKQIVNADPAGEATLDGALDQVASKMERPMFRAFVSSVAGQKFLEAAKQENLAMQAVAMNSSMIDELTQTIQNSSNEESMKAFFASPSESTAAALNLQPLLEACAKCMSCAAQPRVANLGSCDEMLKTCSTVMTKLLKSLRKAVSEEMNQVCMTISKKQDSSAQHALAHVSHLLQTVKYPKLSPKPQAAET